MERSHSRPRRSCPSCDGPLDKIGLSPSGSRIGCGKCGAWVAAPRTVGPDAPPAAPRPEGEEDPSSSPVGLHGLTKASIVLGLRSGAVADAIDELVPRALYGLGSAFQSRVEIAKTLREGLESGGRVELHRGLAFLHLRVAELPEERAALGISPDGLGSGLASPERVFVVCLFLKPPRGAGSMPAWARRRLCDEKTIYRLRTASTVDAVIGILRSA
ncbi:MAG: hypothetical protein HY554_11940 [Elusimicrobia bacterium]|nr:hypothetical protein [Elusimicrobiota bacterium]